MEEKKKPTVSSFLLGQLIATLRLVEEDINAAENETGHGITIAGKYFDEMLQNPAATLIKIEEEIEPRQEQFDNPTNKQLTRELALIHRLKNLYEMPDHPVDEEEFFKGYNQQLKKYHG